MVKELPAGTIRIVDNRIVVGESDWMMKQPVTVVDIPRKRMDPRARAYLQQIIDLANEARRNAEGTSPPIQIKVVNLPEDPSSYIDHQ